MERHDADVGVVLNGRRVVKFFGVVILHIERHWPGGLLGQSVVELLDAGAIPRLAEELRIGEDIEFGAHHAILLAQRKEVYRQHIHPLPGPLCNQAGELLLERWAVAENGQTAFCAHLLYASTSHIVAEILLCGHSRKE